MNFNTFSCINFSLFAKKNRHASESTKLTSVDVRKYSGILLNYFYQANGANYELLDLHWASQRRHYFYITRDSFGQGNKFVFFNFFNILNALVSAPEDDSLRDSKKKIKTFLLTVFSNQVTLSRYLVPDRLARCGNDNNTRRQFDKLLMARCLCALENPRRIWDRVSKLLHAMFEKNILNQAIIYWILKANE